MLVEAYGEHALGKKQCFEWFKTFKSGKFDVRNEDRGKLPKKFKEATNCKPYWMKTILKLNKNSHINWMCRRKPSPFVWKQWERFRKSENGFHMNWTKGSKKIGKSPAKFCSTDSNESHFSIESWQVMKNGSILRILNIVNHGWIQANHRHPVQDPIALERKQCCAFGRIRRVFHLVKLSARIATNSKWSI